MSGDDPESNPGDWRAQLGVEKRLGEEDGVHRASSNSASGSVTVEYDEKLTSAEKLRQKRVHAAQAGRILGLVAIADASRPSAEAVVALRKMHQNLFWAVAYNVVAFPVAAGVFYPYVISPAVAGIAMSGSSALVAVNALLLKRTRLEGVSRAHPADPGTDRPVEATA